MALIEGFRVQNYRALRDVKLGKMYGQRNAEKLTPFTVVIGKNGVGKSTLFDAFGFVADCLETVYEVTEEYGGEFRALGGEHVQLVESLNDSPTWIDALEKMVRGNRQ